jgi:hypothetical protein
VRKIHLLCYNDDEMKDLSRLCEETGNEKLTALIPNAAFKLIKNKTLSPLVSDTVNLILILPLLTLARTWNFRVHDNAMDKQTLPQIYS